MSIVIVLAVIVLICLMCRAALGPTRPTARATAVTEGLAESAGEAASTMFQVLLVHAPPERTTHVSAEPHESASFQVEADEPSASAGYCHADDNTSDTSDASCDSDDGDWFGTDD